VSLDVRSLSKMSSESSQRISVSVISSNRASSEAS